MISKHIKYRSLKKKDYFSYLVWINLPNCIKLVQASLKSILILTLLMLMSGVNIIVIRILFIIGKQIAIVI